MKQLPLLGTWRLPLRTAELRKEGWVQVSFGESREGLEGKRRQR